MKLIILAFLFAALCSGSTRSNSPDTVDLSTAIAVELPPRLRSDSQETVDIESGLSRLRSEPTSELLLDEEHRDGPLYRNLVILSPLIIVAVGLGLYGILRLSTATA
jgi:hypothetical protein